MTQFSDDETGSPKKLRNLAKPAQLVNKRVEF